MSSGLQRALHRMFKSWLTTSLQKATTHFGFILNVSSKNSKSMMLKLSIISLISEITSPTLRFLTVLYMGKQNMQLKGQPLEVIIVEKAFPLVDG